MDIYGYICASPYTQDEQIQRTALLGSGVGEGQIYTDRFWDGKPERSSYRQLLDRLDRGDRLVIKDLGCLGRNYPAILEQWRTLTKEKAVRLTVLDIPYLSSLTDRGAVESLVSEITLELLQHLTEREENSPRRVRQAKGIASAKARGVRFGRPTLPVPEGFETLREAWESGSLSANEAARQLGVATGTFLKWAKNPSAPCDVQETQQVKA